MSNLGGYGGAIVSAANAVQYTHFRFQICCSISKRQRVTHDGASKDRASLQLDLKFCGRPPCWKRPKMDFNRSARPPHQGNAYCNRLRNLSAIRQCKAGSLIRLFNACPRSVFFAGMGRLSACFSELSGRTHANHRAAPNARRFRVEIGLVWDWVEKQDQTGDFLTPCKY